MNNTTIPIRDSIDGQVHHIPSVDRPLVHIEQCVEDMIEHGQVAEAVQFVHDAAEWATFKGLEAFAYGAMLLEIRLTEIAKAVKQ